VSVLNLSDDDDDDETWIYIAHRYKISNALNTLVLRQKECLQHLFEGRFCISDIVTQAASSKQWDRRQQMPDGQVYQSINQSFILPE